MSTPEWTAFERVKDYGLPKELSAWRGEVEKGELWINSRYQVLKRPLNPVSES